MQNVEIFLSSMSSYPGILSYHRRRLGDALHLHAGPQWEWRRDSLEKALSIGDEVLQEFKEAAVDQERVDHGA